MGVHGLWELLAPVGRRVSVETLAGKKLAIDASIWMIQFMKAMRDEKGEMVRNAHLLGFFRRICKLLFLRTKPVFVFDGGTPALKRRTVVARRRQRENAQAKIRKTAEKLLLNHLKARKLEELANDIKSLKDKDDLKGKKVASESENLTENRYERNEKLTGAHNQEYIDELLAASLAAEEDGNFTDNASASVDVPTEEEDDGDEEMMLPVMQKNIDPAVLAALPPSMQLDLLVQMRERLMAENRQKYQKVKKVPTKFSELQIEAYLKTVAFRREIDEVQKSAAGRGVGGVQTSRIASEANREFIFSSSFTGDKQILASAGEEKSGDIAHQGQAEETTSSEPTSCISSTARFSSLIGSSNNEARKDFDNDVETYVDERGRVRLSRLRGLGIRMTRDLQRNLDLMKEFELEKVKENTHTNAKGPGNPDALGSPQVTENDHHLLDVSVGDGDDEMRIMDRLDRTSIQGEKSLQHEPSILAGETAMEISFEDDSGFDNADDDDGLFANLVAGSSISKYTSESVPSGKHLIVEAANQPSFVNGDNSAEGEVDWEEGVCDHTGSASPCLTEYAKTISRGSLEEDADIKEAIRRSLEDFTMEKSIPMSSEIERDDFSVAGTSDLEKSSGLSLEVPELEKDMTGSYNVPLSSVLQSKASCLTVDGAETLETVVQRDILLIDFLKSGSSIGMGVDKRDGYQDSTLKHNDVTEDRNVHIEISNLDGITNPRSVEVQTTDQEKCLANSNQQQEKEASFSECTNGSCKISSHASNVLASELTDVLLDPLPNDSEAPSITNPRSVEVQTTDQEKCLGYSNQQQEREASFSECTNISCKISSHASDVLASELTDVLLDPLPNDSEAPPSCLLSESTNEDSNIQDGAFKDQTANKSSEQVLVAGENHSMPCDGGWPHGDEIASQGNVEHQLEASKASLDEEMLHLRQERINLGDEQRKLERNAESVSSEMFAECQELLQMFGLPYIIAPMEAEAQCAYMELVNLVDGVVTDDSDVFLFGARSVYKNIFDDRKYVETYFMKDVETELGLTREKMIRMALLLGSDYTEGISGIGIVNAIEVVNAFPEEDGLQEFREWLESPDPSILEKVNAHAGHNSRKRRLSTCCNGADGLTNNVNGAGEEIAGRSHDDQQSVNSLPDIKQIFMDKHRNVSKNWHIPSSFPSEPVISAYTSPQVDKSTEPFSWGKPDLFVLRKLCWERFGWGNQKADELIIPVLKEYNKHETQLRLEAFYTFNERFAKIRSKRIKKAVKGITGIQSSELEDDTEHVGPKSRKKRKASPSGTESNVSEKPSDGTNGSDAGNKNKASEKASKEKSRKSGTEDQMRESELGRSFVAQKSGGPKAKNEPRGNARGRGRGRSCRGQRTGVLSHKSTETNSSDGDDSNSEKQIRLGRTKEQSELHRSARQRKHVKYTMKDVYGDSPGSLSDQSEGNCSDALEQETFTDQGINNNSPGPSDPNQASELQPESNLSKDYLFRGGGFCSDEDDGQDGDPIQQVHSPTRAYDNLLKPQRIDSSVAQTSNDGHFSGNDSPNNMNDPQQENMPEQQEDRSGKILHEQMIEERDSLAESAVQVGLRAMPALRRKRRKG